MLMLRMPNSLPVTSSLTCYCSARCAPGLPSCALQAIAQNFSESEEMDVVVGQRPKQDECQQQCGVEDLSKENTGPAAGESDNIRELQTNGGISA